MITGTFTCGSLPGSPFMVLRGKFQLFNDDPRAPDTKLLTYNFDMISTRGETVHFNGYKVVDSSVAFSPLETWRATSTLYVTLTRADESVVGRGILYIQPSDFTSELKTLTPTGRSILSRTKSAGEFLIYFSGQLARVLFAPFNRLQWPEMTTSGYTAKQPPSQTVEVFASDNVPSAMHIWNPSNGDNGHSNAPRILFIPGAAVDHQIFALPTIETNAVEYFLREGFQVFSVTHRVGLTPIAQKGYTTYDARLDIRAALEKIRSIQGSDRPIYVIAHCAGSLALSMGLLDGTIPSNWISGIAASNVFMHPIFGKVNRWKANLPLPLTTIYGRLLGSWYSCISSPEDSLLQRILNQVLRFYPVGPRTEICNSVVCHRSELAFGR